MIKCKLLIIIKIIEIIILMPKLNSIKLREIIKAITIKKAYINNIHLLLIATILLNILPNKCIIEYEKIKNTGKSNNKVKSINRGNSLFI